MQLLPLPFAGLPDDGDGIRNVPRPLESVTTIGGGVWANLRDAVVPIMVPTLISVFLPFMRGMVALSADLPDHAQAEHRRGFGDAAGSGGSSTQAAAFSVLIMLTVLAAMGLMKLLLRRAGLGRRSERQAEA